MAKVDQSQGKKKKRAEINKSHCIGCGVCASKCKFDAIKLVVRKRRVFTPEDNFEKILLQALEHGTLQNFIFDNPQSVSQGFMRALLGGFMRLAPVKKALMSDALRSVFLNAMRAGVKAQGMSWTTEYGK